MFTETILIRLIKNINPRFVIIRFDYITDFFIILIYYFNFCIVNYFFFKFSNQRIKPSFVIKQ